MNGLLDATRLFCLTLLLVCFSARADFPDPIEFDWAIESNQIDKIRGWLDEGLNPEFQGSRMGGGMIMAAWHGNIPIMALFLERGANPRRVNRNGEQALQLAALNGHLEAVKWLIEHGAVLNRDDGRWSALHYAALNGHQAVVRYLIERGANLNARAPNGATPLMMAVREGQTDTVRQLVDSGAEAHYQNDWGDTALSLAIRNNHQAIGQMISTAEEYRLAALAAKAQPTAVTRSVAMPVDVEAVLQKIHEADAKQKSIAARDGRAPSIRRIGKMGETGNPANPMATQTIASPVKPAPVVKTPPVLPGRPATLVISAPRALSEQETVSVLTGAAALTLPGGSDAERGVSELVRQIRLARTQGQPTDALFFRLRQTLTQGNPP